MAFRWFGRKQSSQSESADGKGEHHYKFDSYKEMFEKYNELNGESVVSKQKIIVNYNIYNDNSEEKQKEYDNIIAKMAEKASRDLDTLLSDKEEMIPPSAGEKVLLFFLPKKEREYLPGDLAEEFSSLAARHGIRFAKAWYWKQVITSVGPIIFKYARNVALIGAVGKFYELVKRIL